MIIHWDAPYVARLTCEISEHIGDFDWAEMTAGCSAAHTFRLNAQNRDNSYLKVVDVMDNLSLQQEYERLQWLQGKLPVPRVLGYYEQGEHEFLWMSEIPGFHAAEPVFADKLPEVVGLLARGLQDIHNIDILECPFDGTLAAKIQEAEHNMIAGLVDEANFDTKRQGMRAADLFLELVDTAPHSEDLVSRCQTCSWTLLILTSTQASTDCRAPTSFCPDAS